MIFVPCKDGISHNEIEDAKSDHLEAGCNVLLHAMLERAQGSHRRRLAIPRLANLVSAMSY